MEHKTETAEQRFRDAFERLKAGTPQILPRGTEVTQNNIAREAGRDPSAFRKERYPALIRDIQAWNLAQEKEQEIKRLRRARQDRAREAASAKVKTMKKQRDEAQSKLVRAHRLILELRSEVAVLRTKLNDLPPPPNIFP